MIRINIGTIGIIRSTKSTPVSIVASMTNIRETARTNTEKGMSLI